MLKDLFLKHVKTDLTWSTYNIQKVAAYGALAPRSKKKQSKRGVSCLA